MEKTAYTVNIEINDNIDNPYQEQDPINDPNSPITPSPYNYNPHSEEEATTSSTKNSGNIFETCTITRKRTTDQKWIEAMEMNEINQQEYYMDPYNIATKSEGNRTQMDSNDTKIPMDPGTKLVKAEDGNSVDATYYRSLIGSLRYLLHTRPDLSYAVGLLSRFMQDPKEIHLKAVKQVIRYIKGTKEHGIIYKKEGGCKITGYSDSSYGINIDQGKGTTGIVFYFGESPITWCTQKQQTVALSSCESE
ncbi:hypothetical protein Tco_0195735 [Tanacetum coccineum]